MKASASPWPFACAAFVLTIWGATPATADVIVQKDGQRRECEIVGVAGGQLRVKFGPALTSIPLGQVASVSKDPPKGFEDAATAWQRGDAARTVSLAKPLVETFLGLPTPWAERAAGLLAEAYLAGGKMEEAEKAFAEFQKAYPNSASMSDVGIARLAAARKNFPEARRRLEPILAKARKVLVAEPADSSAYGQAFYLMGTIYESEGAKAAALQCYLTTVTLFPADQAVAGMARERADALAKDPNVVVP